jgi:LysR family transcriptional regulator, repressor for citA
MVMAMDIEWLRTFLVAAEEQNFRRTAERLHLAQPTVTQQIAKLEREWGVHLFERTGHHVALSRAGRRFCDHARTLLTAYTSSLEDMVRWREGREQTLRIAVSPLIATTFLPRWIGEFETMHPNIEFSILVQESDDMMRALLERTADIGFSRSAVTHPDVSYEVLYDDPIVLVAPRDEHDFEGPPRVAADVLANSTVFTHCHPEYWEGLLVQLEPYFERMRTMRVTQAHVALQWITEHMGVSFLPYTTVQREILRGRIEEVPFLTFDLPTAHTYLLQPRQSPGIALKFARFVAEYMEFRGP